MESLIANFQSIRQLYRQIGANDSEVREALIEAVSTGELPDSWGLYSENTNAIEELNNACSNILDYVDAHWRSRPDDEFSQLVDGLDDMLLDA